MTEGILIVLILLLAWTYTDKWSTFAIAGIVGLLVLDKIN